MSTTRLILVRHGQSESNAKDVFTGWADPPLSALGGQQSRDAGVLLTKHDLASDRLHTSVLCRAVATGNLLADSARRPRVPVRRSRRLNGRHYGVLQCMHKVRPGRSSGSNASRPGGDRMMWRPRQPTRMICARRHRILATPTCRPSCSRQPRACAIRSCGFCRIGTTFWLPSWAVQRNAHGAAA